MDQVTCRASGSTSSSTSRASSWSSRWMSRATRWRRSTGLLGLLAKNRCILQLEIYTPEEEMPRRLALLETLFARYGIKFVRAIIADHYVRVANRARNTAKHEQGSGRACASMRKSRRSSSTRSTALNASTRPLHPTGGRRLQWMHQFRPGRGNMKSKCMRLSVVLAVLVGLAATVLPVAPLRRSGCSSPARPSAASSTWRKPSSRAGGRATTSRRCCSTRPPTRCSRRRSSLRARTPRSASSCRIPVSAGSRSPRAIAPRP